MKDKFLIACFARKGREITGDSPRIAAMVLDALRKKGIEAGQFTITPVETYPDNHNELDAVVKTEISSHSRPEIVGKYSGMRHVEKIVLIVPNWRDALPPAVTTFLDQYDFNDKLIVPIVCHDGGGGKNIEGELRKFLPKTWIKPVVEISGKEIDTAGPEIEKAVDELLSND